MEDALFQENDRTAAIADERKYRDLGAFTTQNGFTFENVTVAYEHWGTLNAARDNVVLICHALSGDAHAIGWWDRMVGPGKAFDTDKYFVIATNALGGCQGTTGPSSAAPNGTPYGSRFPVILVEDMVRVQARLLDLLDLPDMHCVAGGSMGGMQALAFAKLFPNRTRKCFATASCAAHSAMQIGFNEVGRQAIMRDPAWMGGDYPLGAGPDNGLSVARMLGHISFLSSAAFDAKFGRRFQDSEDPRFHLGVDFAVESYLNYQGDKFTKRFDANSLLVLTKAIDYFDLGDLEGAKSDFLFVSYDSDWIYPSAQSEAAHRMAISAGCSSEHHVLSLPYGHDAFLLDGELQGGLVRNWLAR